MSFVNFNMIMFKTFSFVFVLMNLLIILTRNSLYHLILYIVSVVSSFIYVVLFMANLI